MVTYKFRLSQSRKYHLENKKQKKYRQSNLACPLQERAKKDLLLLQPSMALLVLCSQDWKWRPVLSTSPPLGIESSGSENMSRNHTALVQPNHIHSSFLPEIVNVTFPGEHNSFLPAYQISVMI